MIIKKKSLIVTAVSCFVLSCVLILTLVGYMAYMELKNEESRRSYQYILGRLNAKIYQKYIDVSGLAAGIQKQGALSGKNIVEGTVKNRGDKDISGLLIKIKFLDADGAIIYETIFDPLEPALGSCGIPQVNIPYITKRAEFLLVKGSSAPFKKVLTSCPAEISSAIYSSGGFSKNQGKWSGRLDREILSVEFA